MHSNPLKTIARGLLILIALVSAGCGSSRNSLSPEAGPSADRSVGISDPLAASPGDDDEAEDSSPDFRWIEGPTTITEPGAYRLKSGFEVKEGDGIVIAASHVKLWLGEHRILGPGNKRGRAVVVQNSDDVLVRGGRIERFGIGVQLDRASRCRVRRVDVKGGDETADPANGNPPQIGILLVNSARNQVVDNQLRGVNLGLFVRGGESYRNRLARNQVVGGVHGLLAICYNPAAGEGPAGPSEDRVVFNVLSRFGTGISASAESARNTFAFNSIEYFDSAYADQNGTNSFRNNRTEQITR